MKLTEAEIPRVFTPATLADYWQCSEQHVRNLINRGELRHVRLGGKLLRIRWCDVEEFECRNGGSQSIGESSPSPSNKMEGANDARSELATDARLSVLHLRTTPN